MLESRGLLGAVYSTLFMADGDHARVSFAVKKGWFGTRDTRGVPPTRHSRALKKMGFRSVGYRDQRPRPLF
jgi:hypothetical protein